jgi:uncharacterized repeat protein (TIGR01451 family)
MLKTRLALLLSPIVLLLAAPSAIAQTATSPLFRETFRGNILENLGTVQYRVTTSRDSFLEIPNTPDTPNSPNDPLTSQSVCLTASQDTTNTVINSSVIANNIPGCAPGLSGLPLAGDAAGNGALRLTSNRTEFIGDGRTPQGRGERGSFIIDSAFPREDGLVVEFDFFIYNGDSFAGPPSADGLSFFLLDGATTSPTPGAFGGSLGYAQATQGGVQAGASNGFIGIGFDVFGNYSAGTEGRLGGPGPLPDSIALRGSAAKGYPFITNIASSAVIGEQIDDENTLTTANFKVRSQSQGPGAVKGRRARITISPEGLLKVELSTQTGENVPDSEFRNVFAQTINLNNADPIGNGTDALSPIPASFKFGFAASTGFSTAIHELRNLVIRPVRNPAVPVRNLRLVKRITALTRSGVRTEFNQFVDDPNTLEDNRPDWSQAGASPVGLISAAASLTVQSQDEIEYTIYYLAEGGTSIADVNLCDSIPTNTTYIPNSSLINRSNSGNTSGGTFFSPLQPIPNPTACPSPGNNNGSILYSLGNLSTQPGQNFGYTRFRTRVNGAQP